MVRPPENIRREFNNLLDFQIHEQVLLRTRYREILSELLEERMTPEYLSATLRDVVELRNMATVADLIVRSALSRQESRGLHYLEEFPNTDQALAHDTIMPGLVREKSN